MKHESLAYILRVVPSGPLMRRVDSLEKTLMLGGMGAKAEGDDKG